MLLNDEQPFDLTTAVASPPVMCWICGKGFTHNRALFNHCAKSHGDYAEYRKRLFWRAQRDGPKPLIPWVKRHILQSATFHLTYSVPGTFNLKWTDPDSIDNAMPRSEAACVVCARKDWLENRLSVYLWREKDRTAPLLDLGGDFVSGGDGGHDFLWRDDHLCFGSREKIDALLGTALYHERMPLIPQEELYASSVLHPEDPTMSWLLHSRRVPLLFDSRKPPTGGAEQPALQWPCAGVGDLSLIHI